jgi:hypothetical protein
VAEPQISISIKDRIEEVIELTLKAVFSTTRVEPWAERNSFDNAPVDGDILYIAGDESTLAASDEGTIGNTDKLLPVLVMCVVVTPENYTPKQQRKFANRRLAALEKAIMTNPYMLEPQTQGGPIRLAVDTVVTGTVAPTVEDGSSSMAVGIEIQVHYRHDKNNPATYSVAIVEKLET